MLSFLCLFIIYDKIETNLYSKCLSNHLFRILCKTIAINWGLNACEPYLKQSFVQTFRHRIPKRHWFLRLRPLLRVLAKHQSPYEQEAKEEFAESDDE